MATRKALLHVRDLDVITSYSIHYTKLYEALRRDVRRWRIERLFAWLLNYRRFTNRWERHAINFLVR